MQANMNDYTKRQVKEEKHAQRVYSMVGRPSLKDFQKMISNNLLHDCPVTVEAINNTETIFGPDMAALKGKTTRPKAPTIRCNLIKVPPSIRLHHNDVEITADVMFVNKISFVLTL